MLPAYANALAKQTPNAELVHDEFFVTKYLGEAVDQVRRAENKDLLAKAEFWARLGKAIEPLLRGDRALAPSDRGRRGR